MWLCLCDCGNKSIVWGPNLRGGRTSSCGCLRAEQLTKRNKITKKRHGMSKSPEYKIWAGILMRCRPIKGESNYGRRGIKVCKRWKKFVNFFKDMGTRPSSKHSIERKNNNGPYNPENCKWGTSKEQCNNKRNNIIVEFKGKQMTLAMAARASGINYQTLHWRFKHHRYLYPPGPRLSK